MIFKDLKKRVYTSLILFILIFLIINSNFALMFVLIILGLYSILEFFAISKKIFINKYHQLIFNCIFTIYIFSYCFMFFFFSNFIQLKIILFSLLIGCVFSDIGGFVFGKIFKGPKLTKISPNKTISGAFGSLIFTCFIICLIFYFYTNAFDYKVLAIGIVTSITCQIGDLFFSFLKRKAKIKDTGNFLPGHGGVLDRVDGILVGIPIGYIILILIY